jgi:hypothetical protein
MTSVKRHVWTSLITATALPLLAGEVVPVSAAPLSHISPRSQTPAQPPDLVYIAGKAGGGGGEGGETGEADPTNERVVLFLALVDELRGNCLAARLAVHDGKRAIAAELLAHPRISLGPAVVRDLEPYGAASLQADMAHVASLAQSGAPAHAITQKIDGVQAALAAVAAKAPRTSLGESRVQAQLLLKSVNRAALQIINATKHRTDLAEFWLGLGLSETARARATTALPLLEWESPEAAAHARTALRKLDDVRGRATTLTDAKQLLTDVMQFELALSRMPN